MIFETSLQKGILIRRYKRFLADVKIDPSRTVTAHVPNTGSMKSTRKPGSPVMLSHHSSPKRKLEWTLELIEANNHWVGVNTALSNRIVEEAISSGKIASLKLYDHIRREVKYGESSRIDLLLERGEERCYVEVKNVTYREGDRALFPDAVTTRGHKHLVELSNMVKAGHRAVIFFLVNRADCTSMGPASEIDKKYSETLASVAKAGVEVLAYRAQVTPKGIHIDRQLSTVLG